MNSILSLFYRLSGQKSRLERQEQLAAAEKKLQDAHSQASKSRGDLLACAANLQAQIPEARNATQTLMRSISDRNQQIEVKGMP